MILLYNHYDGHCGLVFCVSFARPAPKGRAISFHCPCCVRCIALGTMMSDILSLIIRDMFVPCSYAQTLSLACSSSAIRTIIAVVFVSLISLTSTSCPVV